MRAMGNDGVGIRPTGFRSAADDELAALHLIESEIELERRPHSPPQPLASYIGFARSLPSHYDDHTWLAETADGVPVGCSACWTNTAGDLSVMEAYVYVRVPWRRQGVGSRLAKPVFDQARRDGRSRLVWGTYDSLPSGEPFARRFGGRVVRVNRTSELRLADVDWAMVERWIDDGPRRASGYRLDVWEGPYPIGLLDDAATFHHLMNTAPRDDLEVADVVLDNHHVAELDRLLVDAGRQRWTIFIRDRDGRCVGGTEMTFEPWEPSVAQQQNTAVDPAHRGLGLAKWAKAAMLSRVRDERPGVRVVRTGNAFSNEPMLAINNAIGFAVVDVHTEWQADLSEAGPPVSPRPR
jgi:mycothiol synthase